MDLSGRGRRWGTTGLASQLLDLSWRLIVVLNKTQMAAARSSTLSWRVSTTWWERRMACTAEDEGHDNGFIFSSWWHFIVGSFGERGSRRVSFQLRIAEMKAGDSSRAVLWVGFRFSRVSKRNTWSQDCYLWWGMAWRDMDSSACSANIANKLGTEH